MIEKLLNQLLFSEINLISELPNLLKQDIDLNCVDGAIIGTGRSDFTQESTMYNLFISDKNFALIDIPGIEGDECKFEKIIQDSLEKAHTIFYVNGSGKKIEKETLKKLKKYMRDGTTVYAVFNVHCKAKKERIEGIDKSYSDELSEAYDLQQDIIQQTEAELKSIIGENFKGSISVNGLLAFCAYALDANGQTTILDEENKNLRSDQQKYLREFAGNTQFMIRDSHIEEISEIIFEKVDNFEDYIYTENIKKLKNRLSELIEKIGDLREVQTSRVKEFCKLYDEFELNCCHAKEDFISGVNHLASRTVNEEFESIREVLFNELEKNKGKIKPGELKNYLDPNRIVQNIQNNINIKFRTLAISYQDSIKDVIRRFFKDINRGVTMKYFVSFPFNDFVFDMPRIENENLSDISEIIEIMIDKLQRLINIFSSDDSKWCKMIYALIAIGNFISSIFKCKRDQCEKEKKTLKYKLEISEKKISDRVESEIKKFNIPGKVNENFKQIENLISFQKKNLKNILLLLEKVYTELMQKKRNLE